MSAVNGAAAGLDHDDAVGHSRTALVRRTTVNANADTGVDGSTVDGAGRIGEQMILVVVRSNHESMPSRGNHSSFDDMVVPLRLGRFCRRRVGSIFLRLNCCDYEGGQQTTQRTTGIRERIKLLLGCFVADSMVLDVPNNRLH